MENGLLNDQSEAVRRATLLRVKAEYESGERIKVTSGPDVNNHIHTTYSFSPYSPTMAVYRGYMAGLKTVGLIDHDNISGAREFLRAAQVFEMAATIGVECRVDMSNTPLNGRRINNPDQDSIIYVAMHGVPHTQIDMINDFFAPYRAHRNQRNRQIVDNINAMMAPLFCMDFDRDVVPLSNFEQGGSITERHIMYALAKMLTREFGRGKNVCDFLQKKMKLNISPKIYEYLTDTANPYYDYDLLGLFKSEFLPSVYVPATLECPDVRDIAALADRTGAILAYAYLGDVGESVTGDKRAQKFEDDYIELVFDTIKDLGFRAVTYMPSRNTQEQITRVRTLCEERGLLQISGEDVNSPRQSFIFEKQREEQFANLFDSTWALIGHEKVATMRLEDAFFSPQTIEKYPNLNERIQVYKKLGMTL